MSMCQVYLQIRLGPIRQTTYHCQGKNNSQTQSSLDVKTNARLQDICQTVLNV